MPIRTKTISRKRQYTWFIEPKDSHTNKIIGERLPEENAHYGIVCADGIKRYLWQCSQDLVYFLWKSREDLDLKFETYRKIGNGKIRNCTFLYKPKSKGKKKKR